MCRDQLSPEGKGKGAHLPVDNRALSELEQLFPNIANCDAFLFTANGSIEDAAHLIMDSLNDSQDSSSAPDNEMAMQSLQSLAELASSRHVSAAAALNPNRVATPDEKRKALMERYFLTSTMKEGHSHRPHISQVHSPALNKKVMVRWRGSNIATRKGERFVKGAPRETKEQIDRTSVNLAWIKKKRKGGQKKRVAIP